MKHLTYLKRQFLGVLCMVLAGGIALGQTPEEKHQLVTDYIAAWNTGDLDRLADIVHPEFVRHYAGHVPAEGVDALKELVIRYRSAFSDFEVQEKDRIYTGDRIIVTWEVKGTNDGPFLQYDPTGHKAMWSGISIVRIRDGKFSEEWVVSDMLDMYHQMGYELMHPSDREIAGEDRTEADH